MKNPCLKFYTCTFVMISVKSCKTSTAKPNIKTLSTNINITTTLTSGIWTISSIKQENHR